MACVLVRHFSREIKIFLSMISLRHEVHGVSQIKITFSLDIFLSCVHNRYKRHNAHAIDMMQRMDNLHVILFSSAFAINR